MNREAIRNASLRGRVTGVEEAASYIRGGMTVAFDGFTSAGYPKAVPAELRRRADMGEDLQLRVVSGTMIRQLDELLSGVTAMRTPLFESAALRKSVNAGKVHYVEQQMCKMVRLLYGGAFGKVDVAVVEALEITEEGFLVPTASVGILPHIVEVADTVIVELNAAQPKELAGLHDIFLPGLPPQRRPIPMLHVAHRFGEPFVRVNPEKIKAIVCTDEPDGPTAPASPTDPLRCITDHLFNFLELESACRWGSAIPPVQIGFGNLASSIALAFGASKFQNLSFFCGTLLEEVIRLIRQDKVRAASAASMQMTPGTVQILREMSPEIREILVLRNQDLTNDSETIGRMGIMALNSAIEVDIYGNVNSSHIAGTKIVNGIGGGANFAQNAGLSVMLLPSSSHNDTISNLVPMVSHVDITEHDIDVLITDQGVADLRGKDDLQRAMCIIEHCASPAYHDMLRHYLDTARKKAGGHHPQLPAEACQWHRRFLETGTMQA